MISISQILRPIYPFFYFQHQLFPPRNSLSLSSSSSCNFPKRTHTSTSTLLTKAITILLINTFLSANICYTLAQDCIEHSYDEFVFKVKVKNNGNTKVTTRTCAWLQTNKPNKIGKICKKELEHDGIESAKDACPITCEVACGDDDQTQEPSSIPSSTPSSYPSFIPSPFYSVTPSEPFTCQEDEDTLFVFKLKSNGAALKQCGWLASQKAKKINKSCNYIMEGTYEGIGPASMECPITCELCEPEFPPSDEPSPLPTSIQPTTPPHSDCEEDPDDEFVFKLKEKAVVDATTQTCNWLQRQASKKVEPICLADLEWPEGGIGKARDVCSCTCAEHVAYE